MYQTILVPLDGSAVAERALPFAQKLVEATGARLVLVRAVLLEPSSREASVDRQAEVMTVARSYLTTVANQLTPTTPSETMVLYGDATAAILSVINSRRVDIVVMSSHGSSGLGRWVTGSVTDRLLRKTDIPVMIVPGECLATWANRCPFRIVIPLDGSAQAEAALGSATYLAHAFGATLTLIRVNYPVQGISVGPSWYLTSTGQGMSGAPDVQHYLDLVAARVRSEGIPVEVRSAVGTPGVVIASTARDLTAQLIAMTPHGAAGTSRLMLGRAATTILQNATTPVLLVRPSTSSLAQPRLGSSAEETGLDALPVSIALTPEEQRLIARGLENILVAKAHTGYGTREIQELLTRLECAGAPFDPPMVQTP